MKLLVDVGVGAAVEVWLEATGHDVLSVRSLNPRMTDADILARAVNDDRLVMTMDKDFGELVYASGRHHSGVLLLRLDDATGEQKVEVVNEIFTHYSQQLPGSFSVYHRGRLRIRPRREST